MALTRIDHVQEGLAKLISQYKNKPRIQASLTSFLEAIQPLEDGSLDVSRLVLNLDEAVGDNLDICGAILNEERGGAPDFIYRRRIKTKVQVIRSQGRVEDLIKVVRTYLGALQSDGIIPDNSDIYFTTSQTWNGSVHVPEGRGMEITVIPASSNSYTDPKPFDPKGAHDQLLLAKGGGEELQTIWAIVGPNKQPKFDSLRLIHNPTGNLPASSSSNGLGSVYLTGSNSDYSSIFGGSIGHRRASESTFADAGLPYNVSTPIVVPTGSNTWRIGGGLAVTPGVWGGLPESLEYTILRDGVEVEGYSSVPLDQIKEYTFSSSDLSSSWQIRETALSLKGRTSVTSNLLWAPYAIYKNDPNLVGHWNFSNAYWLDSTSSIRTDTANATNGSEWYLLPNHLTSSPDAIWKKAYNVPSPTVTSSNQKFVGNFDGTQIMYYSNNGGTSFGVDYSQPFEIMVVISSSDLSDRYILGGKGTGTYFSIEQKTSPNSYAVDAGAGLQLAPTASTNLTALWFAIDDNNSETKVYSESNFKDSNGVSIAPGTLGWRAITLGVFADNTFDPPMLITGSTNAFVGQIMDIMIRTGSLGDTSVRSKWASYVKHIWGIEVEADEGEF